MQPKELLSIKAILFDLDMTLVDTSCLLMLRSQRKWDEVYSRIPETQAYEGIDIILGNLKEKYKIGIVTSSPKKYALKVVEHYGFDIPVLAGYHETTLHKPSPEPILYGINELQVKPESSIYIGDQVNDIVAAKAANCMSIGVTWGDDLAEDIKNSAPDFIANNPIELQSIIDNND